MSNLIIIPFINPVKYTESQFADLPEYQSKHMDDYPYFETIKKYEQHRRFFQPWGSSDSIYQQVFSNVGPVTLNVKDCHGNILLSQNFIQRQEDENNPTLFLYESDLDLAPFGARKFYLEIAFAGTYKVISEPMEILSDTSETIFAEYTNTPFYEGLIFQDGFKPGIRFYGRLKYKKTSSIVTSYEDDPLDAEILNARNFRLFTLFISSASGIPDYFADKLARVLHVNDLWIDGRAYSCLVNDLSENTVEFYPMKGWSVEIRERYNRTAKYFSTDVNTNQQVVMMANVESKGFIPDDEGGSFFQILDVE
jgi:hypothetical protein